MKNRQDRKKMSTNPKKNARALLLCFVVLQRVSRFQFAPRILIFTFTNIEFQITGFQPGVESERNTSKDHSIHSILILFARSPEHFSQALLTS